MFAYSNYWLSRRQRRIVVDEINKLLLKFIGYKSQDKDALYTAMRKIVMKYFKDNIDKIRFFDASMDYDFEIQEINGKITVAKFHI